MELFRFRIVRPALSQPCDGLDVTTKFQSGLEAEGLKRAAAAVPNRPTTAVTAIETWLAEFSSQLAQRGDLVAPADCTGLLPGSWLTDVGSQAWASLAQRLVSMLVAAMTQSPPPPATVEAWCRKLLVFDLVATLASDRPKPANEQTLQTAADVQAMVSWRHVILPKQFFTDPRTPLLARRPGVTDFYVVHDEWHHYQAGELAAVINVLPGETFENRIRHSQEVDTLTATTTVTTTSQLTEQQQTTSSSLSEASSKDASLNIGVQAQVQTSGQYGATHVDTSLGAQLQVSQSQSDSKASTTAFQTVQRAVKSVTQQVTTVQSQRTITRDSTYDDHKLQNTGQDVTVGLYRWLSEVHWVQLVRYPNRFVLEFEIPEPGAWVRWALLNTPTTNWDNPDPGPFQILDNSNPPKLVDISPDIITAKDVTGVGPPSVNYTQLAQKWQVRGLAPPPASSVTAVWNRAWNNTQGSGPAGINDQIAIPDGYEATKATIMASMGAPLSQKNPVYVVVVQLGADSSGDAIEARFGNEISSTLDKASDQPYTTNLNGERGTLGVTLGFADVASYQVNIEVECALTKEAFGQWQQDTFDQVAAAYQTRLSAYQQERDTRSQQVGGLADLTGPPELNQQRVVNELRRMVIQDLRGVLTGGQDSPVMSDGTSPFSGAGEPYVPVRQPPATETETIQFFEQALEWENIVYICYPYYWARHNQWVTNVTSASADPVFDQFLNAGSARLVVPARPGFENLVLFYLYTGLIWGGSQPPAPNDPDYLSVAQEIQDLQKGATDGTPVGDSWSITLPTTLLWAGTDSSTLPQNDNTTIPAPPGT